MKITCMVSGKQVNVTPKVFQARADKAGVGVDVLKSSYISRESKRFLREGKTVEEIRTLSGVQNLPEVPAELVTAVTSGMSRWFDLLTSRHDTI